MVGPKYLKIKNELKKEIKSGNFASGDKFYSEKELINKFNVSSITVIRAIQELVNEGLLVRFQGKGTFISRSRKKSLVEFSDIELFEQNKEVVKVISIKKDNDLSVLKELNLSDDDTFYQIIRVRMFNDEPFIVQFSYIPSKYIKYDGKNSEAFSSIYHRFMQDFSINPGEQDFTETNEICFPTPDYIANFLKIQAEEPTIFQQKKTTIKDTDEVIEFIESYKKWSYYKIEFTNAHLN